MQDHPFQVERDHDVFFTVFMIQNAREGSRLQARFNKAVFESLRD